MRQISGWSACGLALTLALVGACGPTPKVAVIGMAGVGSDALFLKPMADSLMALPQPIRVKIFDGGQASDAYRTGLQTAQQVVQMPGLVAVVGHQDSRSTLVVGPVYRDAGVPLVVPNATSRAIRNLGPRVFMMEADNGEEGTFLSHVAVNALAARRVTIFHLSDEFGMDLDESVRSALDSAGARVIDDVEYGLNRWSCPDDFRALVDASLTRGVPDVVVLGSRTRDARCIVRLFGERAPGVRFLAGDGVNIGESLVDRLGPAADRMWVVHFWSSEQDSASRAFAAEYERRVGTPPDAAAALRWDAVWMVAEAVKAVGPKRDRVTSYLRDLGRGRPRYEGVSGAVSFGSGAVHPFIVVDAWGHPVARRGW